jgi:uroporphyrinogen III methyltransferase/synthase
VGALSGKRILVTRPREQAEKTAALIRSRGGEPVLLPAIEVHAPDDAEAVERALDRAREYAWVAFTSANGVEWTWKALERRRGAGAAFERARFAAIGPGTAEALTSRGVKADVVATESKGEGFAEALLAAMAPGDSVLLLRAQVAREAFTEALRKAGHEVDPVAVYRTSPASPEDVARVVAEIRSGSVQAVTFTSGSTVESFVALVGGAAEARGLLAATVVVSIGPITTSALQAHGVHVDRTADPYTLDGMLEALERAFAGG